MTTPYIERMVELRRQQPRETSRAGSAEPRMRLLEVRTGRTEQIEHRGRGVPSAFRKGVRTGPVAVTACGIEGDEQADLRAHGGPDKALCAYPVEHYAWWRRTLGREMPPGSFGENLLVEGLDELAIHLGDRFRIGEVDVEVTQPRRPCFKLAAIHDVPDLPKLMQSSGRSGFYLRVLAAGRLQAGDVLEPLGGPVSTVTVAELNRVMNVDKLDLAAVARLSADPFVPDRWRRSLARRLAGHGPESDTARLQGP